MPPCGLARSVLEGLAALEAALVTTLVTTSVIVDMAAGIEVCSCRSGWIGDSLNL